MDMAVTDSNFASCGVQERSKLSSKVSLSANRESYFNIAYQNRWERNLRNGCGVNRFHSSSSTLIRTAFENKEETLYWHSNHQIQTLAIIKTFILCTLITQCTTLLMHLLPTQGTLLSLPHCNSYPGHRPSLHNRSKPLRTILSK